MFSTVCYQREDGTEGKEAYESEQEACLALEKAFYRHHARGYTVSVKTREDGTTLYVVRDADGEIVEKHKLFFLCSEGAASRFQMQ